MGLTMHSPGGIPGTSSAVTWNHTAADRAYPDEVPGWMYIAPAILGATTLGVAYRTGIFARALYTATRPMVWAGYNAFKEYQDITHALKGGKFEVGVSLTYRPLRFKGFMHRPLAIAIPFPWIDFQGVHVEGSSSHGLVQNGGPSAPLQISAPRTDIITLGKISKSKTHATPSNSGGKREAPQRASGDAKHRRGGKKRCPPGHRWNGFRCVPIRKR